jgi:hypothetical protein
MKGPVDAGDHRHPGIIHRSGSAGAALWMINRTIRGRKRLSGVMARPFDHRRSGVRPVDKRVDGGLSRISEVDGPGRPPADDSVGGVVGMGMFGRVLGIRCDLSPF